VDQEALGVEGKITFEEFKAFKISKSLNPPPSSLPRDAGEDRHRGLNRAQQLNGLNDLNV
jgi:hypothetical protein